MTLERSEPPYLQIARQIREDIESGVLAEGSPIPSARQIATRWGVALATATKVQAHLRSEGLVEPIPGVGSIVTARREAAGGRSYLKSSRASGLIYGGKRKARITAAELLEASTDIASALGLEAGSPVVRRERITFADGDPCSLSVSWLPGDRVAEAPRLLRTGRIAEGTFAYLADVLGVSVTSGHEQICAASATEQQAHALNITPGSPVLLTRTWFVADDGQVLEFGEGVSPEGEWLTHEFTL